MPQAVYLRSSMATSFNITQSVVNIPSFHLRLAQLASLWMGLKIWASQWNPRNPKFKEVRGQLTKRMVDCKGLRLAQLG